MIFCELPLDEAVGALLAHSYKTSKGRIGKGQILTHSQLENLRADGITHVMVAKLGDKDVPENQAASTLATELPGNNIAPGIATTGRVNLHAQCDGLFDCDANTINAINRIHESITVATINPSTRVVAGQIVATVKIIPYAVDSEHLDRVLSLAEPTLCVYKLEPKTACLIQTTIVGMKETILNKTRRVTENRLLERQATLLDEQRVDHNLPAILDALKLAEAKLPDWILIFGASATSDRNDTVPAALVACKGQVHYFGMPVDPGNLLLLGKLNRSIVIGMPGCARSAKLNGVDHVLDRLACGVPVESNWIAGLGVGGLLKEIVDRPWPRVGPNEKLSIAALVLCAGSSRRFGTSNKLLSNWNGKPLISKTLETILESSADLTVIVTGYERRKITITTEASQTEHNIRYIHNEAFSTGMASSLKRGVSELIDTDAIIVCLGDMPLITTSVIEALIQAYKQNSDKALYIPTWQGQRGNPVLIARKLYDSLLTLEGDTGARLLAREFPDTVMEVPTQCPGILTDIDTEADLIQQQPD